MAFIEIARRAEIDAAGQAKLAVIAASLGTVFEWYDFYLYGSLAVFFSTLFFPPGNAAAAFMASLATFGAGFAARPFGALVFGSLADRIGRKRSFLVTMAIMGLATVAVGLLPTYQQVGVWAPVLLVAMRLAQGLAVGGEYGGAVTYVAEHAARHRRGFATSWMQTTATVGFLLSLLVILTCRTAVGEDVFKAWGWRIPFLVSIVLLAVSVYVRLKLDESPVFVRMKSQARTAKSPVRESFGSWQNLRAVLVTLFGMTCGMTVIWYTAQFYALFFVQNAMHVDYRTSYVVFTAGLIAGTPLIVVFGAVSDWIGRKPIMITGLLLGCLTLMPAFHALATFTNPGLLAFIEANPIKISADGCTLSFFAKPVSDCDKARDFFSREGLSFASEPAPAGGGMITAIGDVRFSGFDGPAYRKVLESRGFNGAASHVNYPGAIMMVVWMLALVGMVYGPMAAFMVEMFPAKIRSTSLSFPYHLGVGILGGFLPFIAAALVAYTGNIFAGLWYPVAVASATAVIGLIFLPETKDRAID